MYVHMYIYVPVTKLLKQVDARAPLLLRLVCLLLRRVVIAMIQGVVHLTVYDIYNA